MGGINNAGEWPGSGQPAEMRDGFAIRNTSDATKVVVITVPDTANTGVRTALTLPPLSGALATLDDANSAPLRWGLQEDFKAAPQLSAVTQLPGTDTYNTATFLANQIANHYFEVLGTSAVSADVTQYVEGGIAVATHGATNDSTIILPHLVANQSPWTKVTWGTDQQTRWSCTIQTPSAVTALKIWAGLKLTNTPVVTTDAKQAFFKYDSAVGTDPTLWHTIYSINNVDTEVGVGSAVAASTNYTLAINIDSSRVATFYINGVLMTTSTALDDATDFIPYIGIQDTSAGSARSMKIYHEVISRKVGA